MAKRDREERRQQMAEDFVRLGDVHIDELKRTWLGQLPTVAALFAVEQEDPEDFESAIEQAFEFLNACAERLEG